MQSRALTRWNAVDTAACHSGLSTLPRLRGRQAKALSRSARRSSTSSIPTLSRTRPSSMPRAARISAGMLACVIVAG